MRRRTSPSTATLARSIRTGPAAEVGFVIAAVLYFVLSKGLRPKLGDEVAAKLRELVDVTVDPRAVNHAGRGAPRGSPGRTRPRSVLDGRSSTVTVAPDTPILDAARMRRNYALDQDEVEAGYVLTCQALPVSDQVNIDYDTLTGSGLSQPTPT